MFGINKKCRASIADKRRKWNKSPGNPGLDNIQLLVEELETRSAPSGLFLGTSVENILVSPLTSQGLLGSLLAQIGDSNQEMFADETDSVVLLNQSTTGSTAPAAPAALSNPQTAMSDPLDEQDGEQSLIWETDSQTRMPRIGIRNYEMLGGKVTVATLATGIFEAFPASPSDGEIQHAFLGSFTYGDNSVLEFTSTDHNHYLNDFQVQARSDYGTLTFTHDVDGSDRLSFLLSPSGSGPDNTAFQGVITESSFSGGFWSAENYINSTAHVDFNNQTITFDVSKNWTNGLDEIIAGIGANVSNEGANAYLWLNTDHITAEASLGLANEGTTLGVSFQIFNMPIFNSNRVLNANVGILYNDVDGGTGPGIPGAAVTATVNIFEF